MRTIALVVVLLAACGRKHPAAPVPLTIAITRDGFVKVEGRAVTLDELGATLAARREAGPREQVDHAADVSALAVVVDPEDDATWAHVTWVMVVLAEEKFWRLSFPGGRDAPLPADRGLCPITGPPDGVALLLCVLVREDGEYAFGKRTTPDVRQIGAWIDAAPREGVLCRIGVIRAQPRAPWRYVRPIFDLLRGRGVKRIEFYGPELPPRESRERSPLPPPSSDGQPRRWSGPAAVSYWEHEEYYGEEEPPIDEDLWTLIEAHDLRLGLPRPGRDDTLAEAARLHAEEMVRMGYFGHFSPVPGNRSPSDRLAKLGWPEERRHVEILAKAETAEAAFNAILAKPENAAFLADPAFKYAGVAQCGDCWVVLLGAEK